MNSIAILLNGYKKMDLFEIKKLIPHRYPFLFIDKVVEFDTQKREIICLKYVSSGEFFFQGHFPDNPIMPGVLITEAMAQAGILLYACLKPEIAKKHPTYVLGKIEAGYRASVVPGDILTLKVTADKIMDSAGVVDAVAFVDDVVVSESKIYFGIKANG